MVIVKTAPGLARTLVTRHEPRTGCTGVDWPAAGSLVLSREVSPSGHRFLWWAGVKKGVCQGVFRLGAHIGDLS